MKMRSKNMIAHSSKLQMLIKFWLKHRVSEFQSCIGMHGGK